MNEKNILKEYYKNCKVWLPSNPNWRIFKFHLFNNKFIKIYIHNEQEMRRYLLKYLPKSVYYSVSCFLSPRTIKYIHEPYISRRNILYSDLVFDIDAHDGNFEKAKQDTIKLVKFMKDYKLNYILFSGGGFQVAYTQEVPAIKNPKEREEYLKEEREKIVNKIKSKNINVDEAITLDLNRVVRLPNTINVKRGQIAKIITKKSLSSFHVPTRIIYPMTERTLVEQRSTQQNDVENEREGISSLHLLSNEIYAMNRFPLFLLYKNKTLKQVKNDLIRLQETYNLSDILIFKKEEDYYGICLQTFQQKRLQKIVKASKAEPLQVKFNRSWLNMPFYYIDTIKSNKKNVYVSRPHTILLNKIFDLNLDYPNQHGEKLNIISAQMKE